MPASAVETAVRAAFAEQAGWCRTLDSPLTAQVCDLLAEQPWPDGAVAERLRAWPGDPRASSDAVPLRLCGGLHAAVRARQARSLAACYPPHPLPQPEAMWPPLAEAFANPLLSEWLDRPPQTNEVGRSNALVAGLLAFADRFSLPIDLIELGASAGLNLQLDRFGFDLGGNHTGDPGSPLQLTPEWRGPPPPSVNLEIASRSGVDRTPLDPARDADRLLAFVWADQTARLAQLDAAIAIAKAHPLTVEQGDAGEWLEARFMEPQPDGIGHLIMHSIAFQYFAPETQARVEAAIERAGDQATGRKPLGWLRFERLADERSPSLRLRSWPGGEDRLLARCHPHGAWIKWLADPVR